ncbi:MAG: GNAT family N-acetyltransferase [Phycisphaeraceae bacterium]|nr:GNAT family N-acetyltransferase [Phycisphaeraceae bacterium]
MIEPNPAHGRYTLRPAAESDRLFVVTLWRDSLGSYAVPLFGKWYEEISEKSFTANQPSNLKIIMVRGEMAGVLCLRMEGDKLYLGDLELLPAYRNRGLGTRLLQDINAYADAKGLVVELQVLVTNPARSLYERLGFRPIHLKMQRTPDG